MIKAPDSVKRYNAARHRFLRPVLINFFAREFPKLFGPLMRERIAEELIDLFLEVAAELECACPGLNPAYVNRVGWIAVGLMDVALVVFEQVAVLGNEFAHVVHHLSGVADIQGDETRIDAVSAASYELVDDLNFVVGA